MWGDQQAGVVSIQGSTLRVAAFQGSGDSMRKDVTFDQPIVAFEALGSSQGVVVAVQLCADPAPSSGDQYELCRVESSYRLLTLVPGASNEVSAPAELKGQGDLAGLSVSSNWIGIRIGQDFHLADRSAQRPPERYATAGLSPCVAGNYVVSRDPTDVQIAPTTMVGASSDVGRVLLQRAGDPRDTVSVDLPVQPSAVVCGPEGIVVAGGNGAASQVVTVRLKDTARDPTVADRVSGSAALAQQQLGRNQVALVSTFAANAPGALFVSPDAGVVSRVDGSDAGLGTDARRDQVLATSFFFVDGTMTAISPTKTGWEFGEVTQ